MHYVRLHDTYVIRELSCIMCTGLYTPVGRCRRNSRTSDCIRRLRFGRSYSERYSRCDPPRTAASRHRGSRLCTCICNRPRRTSRIARSRGTEMDSSRNRTSRIDRPPCCIRDYTCTRNASSWGGRCTVRSPRSRNCRCTRLEREEIIRRASRPHLDSIPRRAM
jgi:hypothetical protein